MKKVILAMLLGATLQSNSQTCNYPTAAVIMGGIGSNGFVIEGGSIPEDGILGATLGVSYNPLVEKPYFDVYFKPLIRIFQAESNLTGYICPQVTLRTPESYLFSIGGKLSIPINENAAISFDGQYFPKIKETNISVGISIVLD